jgi:DNA-binding transcriptional MerR regulator
MTIAFATNEADVPMPEGAATLTIDELAAQAQVPSRTIRFYQSKGALMAPEIRGRVAYYGPAHVERLKLIAQLQDRGLRIDAIRDVMGSIDKGELDLAEWLGVEQQVQAPWANDQPRTVTEAELYELAGARRPGLLGDLIRTKLAERHGDVYIVKSPALLVAAMKLEAAGLDFSASAAAAEILKKHLKRMASDLLDFFVRQVEGGHVGTDDYAALFQALRPTAMDSIRVVFGREMERGLRKLVESGTLAQLPARARKAKKKR